MRKKVLRLLVITGMLALAGCGKKNTQVKEKKTIMYSMDGGIYDEDISVAITTEEEGEIYYTLDGSDPATSESAILYKDEIKVTKRDGDKNVVSAVDPLLISANFNKINSERNGFDLESKITIPADEDVDKCTVIRAKLKYKDGSYSDDKCNTYFIGDAKEHIPDYDKTISDFNENLAVISISMNYDDLFDYEKGIYVKGKCFDDALSDFLDREQLWDADTARRLSANYNQRGREWEREAGVAMFELNKDGEMEEVISQDCGIRIQGNYSRSDLQKGFRLYARNEYGKKNFKYEVFGEKCKDYSGETVGKFKHLVLRAGGNCAFNAKFNDTYWQSLVTECNVSSKCSRPCVVYLNGEYWGVYVLEEDFSDDYFETHYGVNKESVVVYKGDAETYASGYKLDIGNLPEGESEKYFLKDLTDFNYKHPTLENDEDYQELCKLIDEQSFMDYFAIECFINNKWDWPGKNWSIWKTDEVSEDSEYADGRFRLMVYDVEFGGISGKQDAYVNTIKEDNYRENGLLDKGTNNPIVKTFAILMTNKSFREAFEERLLGLSTDTFEKTKLQSRVDEFESAYMPIMEQFFKRYPGTGSVNDATNGGYASIACLRDFIEERENYIQDMVDFCEKIEVDG